MPLAEHVPTAYLPLSSCESIADVPGASSIATVCTIKGDSGAEVVVIGATDGFVYFVYGSASRRGYDDTVVWRRLAISVAPSELPQPTVADATPQDAPVTPPTAASAGPSSATPLLHGESPSSVLDDNSTSRWLTPYHHKIQSVCAFIARDGPLDNASFGSARGAQAKEETVVLAVVSVQRGATKASVFLHVYAARSLSDALYPKAGPVVVGGVPTVLCVEWRRMKLPDAHLPLRLFHHPRFVSPGPAVAAIAEQPSPMQRGADQLVLSAMVRDPSAPQQVASAVAVLVLPHSGTTGPTPPSLHWVPTTATSSQEQLVDSIPHRTLAWSVARALRLFALAPVSAMAVLAAPSAWMQDAAVTVVFGCVDGAFGVLEVAPPHLGQPATNGHAVQHSTTNSGPVYEPATLVASLRGSGPIGDCCVFHPRTDLHFQPPNALMDCLEDVHHVVDRSPATVVTQRVMVLDSSGKVVVVVLERCGGRVQVRTSLLPDYVSIADAKLVPAPMDAPTTGDVTASSLQKKPPLASKRSAFSAFPDIALGFQNRLMAVSAFFRSQNSRTHQQEAGEHPRASTVPSDLHEVAEQISRGRPSMAASSGSMSASPGASVVLDFLTNAASAPGSEELGALLGVGPIAISECDVDGDGWNELVITTMGRFVAMYRYDAETGQFACVEAAEAPTHMYYCKQARLWEHSAVPAWIICGPSHLLVQCASHLRDTIMARARLLERCVAPSVHFSQGGVDT